MQYLCDPSKNDRRDSETEAEECCAGISHPSVIKAPPLHTGKLVRLPQEEEQRAVSSLD